jgi:hypothetical protein
MRGLFVEVFGDARLKQYTRAKESAKAAGADEFDAGARFAVAVIEAAFVRAGLYKIPDVYEDEDTINLEQDTTPNNTTNVLRICNEDKGDG